MSTKQENSSTTDNVSNAILSVLFEQGIMFFAKKGCRLAQERYAWKTSIALWENDSRWNDIKERYPLDWEGLFSIGNKQFWRSIFVYIQTTNEKEKYNRLVTLVARTQMAAHAQSDSEKEIVCQVLKRLIDAVENGWRAKLSWGDKALESLKPYVNRRLKDVEKQFGDAERNIIAALNYQGSFAAYVDGLNIHTEQSNHPMDYRGTIVPFIGRTAEIDALQGFLNTDQPFLWWSIIGSDGIGKSKLALELCRMQNNSESWKACFLNEQALKGWNANYIHPKNLLLVVDSASRISGDVKSLLSDMAQSKNIHNKIRVLLIENSAGREEQRPEWFPADLLACCYQQDHPFLKIGILSNNEQRGLLDSFTQNCSSPDYTANLDSDGKQTILTALSTIDSQAQRPLFLLLMADAWRRGEKNMHHWNISDLREQLKRNGRGIIQQYELDDVILAIQELNRQFKKSFHPICEQIIHRNETVKCLQEIESGNSFILHGRAGTGKSGCIIELLNQLEQRGILSLAIKMDERTPGDNSRAYGQKMGLPDSPVECLEKSSPHQAAVLLLDQLDAVRWTASHSATALDVCSQMIEQAKAINRYREQKIIIAFVCRTFDLEYDNSIKGLFHEEKTSELAIDWRKIEVKELSDIDVAETVGKENYAQLFPKVKGLLRLPQNLYVWTHLGDDDKNVNFTSSSDLTKKWWDLIVSRYIQEGGHDECELKELKSALVHIMETQGKLAVPEILLNNYSQRALHHLLSGGMLLKDGQTIRFVHQSFFDYFSMGDMFERLYGEETIVDILGDRQRQTPTKRYQLQMLFENLLSTDTVKFAEVGRVLLQSERVRFFLKYVFLEVLGQALRLTDELICFVKEYLDKSEWRMHIIDAVVYGHPVFMRSLLKDGTIRAWINGPDTALGFNLIRSISGSIPDETYEFFQPMVFTDKDLDQKIFNCLPHDFADDSESLFHLRMDLLLRNPELWVGFMAFWKELIERNPQRAMQMFVFAIENCEHWSKRGQLYFDNEAEDFYLKAAQERAQWVWDTFLPHLANSTANIISPYDKKLEPWQHRQHAGNKMARLYMRMTIEAAKVLIEQTADCFFHSVQLYMASPSLPVHEIVLHVLGLLPAQFSDDIIRWFIEDLEPRMLEKTSENEDKMLLAKMAIAKHAKTCSDEVFSIFENLILKSINKNALRRRLNYYREERKRNAKGICSYYETSYWGDLQHYLLSVVEYSRLSDEAKGRLCVLRRIIPKDYIPHYHSMVTGGFVHSPVANKAKTLRDNQWLQIICNSSRIKGRQSQKWGRNGTFEESTPEQFSSDLYEVGKNNPYRIALLALNFPLDVDSDYINTVNRTIEISNVDDKVKAKTVDLDLAQQIILKYKEQNLCDTALSFCRAISCRASEVWSNEILEMVIYNATKHEDPNPGQMNIIYDKDKESVTVESLMTNEINCVRGVAVGTIASLIWEDSSRYSLFKKAIESAIEDQHLAVNFAVMECVCAVYNVDRETAIKWFIELAKKDIRIVAHYRAYQMFYRIKAFHPADIDNLVVQMISSSYADVAKIGAEHMADMHIRDGSFSLVIFDGFMLTLEQKKAMLDVAIQLLQHVVFHEKSKQVIAHFMGDEEAFGDTCASIFFHKSVSIENDLPFIKQILSVRTGRRAIRYFIDFINETNIPIYKIRDVLLTMCDSLVKNAKDETKNPSSELYGVGDELSKLITLLYDRAQKEKDMDATSQCLDMWDMMYRERIGNIREISRSIAEL